jgi:excisionase family DNA binding protein
MSSNRVSQVVEHRPGDLLSRREAAKYLSIGTTLLRKLAIQKQLHGLRIGTKLLYRRRDLDALIAHRLDVEGKS